MPPFAAIDAEQEGAVRIGREQQLAGLRGVGLGNQAHHVPMEAEPLAAAAAAATERLHQTVGHCVGLQANAVLDEKQDGNDSRPADEVRLRGTAGPDVVRGVILPKRARRNEHFGHRPQIFQGDLTRQGVLAVRSKPRTTMALVNDQTAPRQ